MLFIQTSRFNSPIFSTKIALFSKKFDLFSIFFHPFTPKQLFYRHLLQKKTIARHSPAIANI